MESIEENEKAVALSSLKWRVACSYADILNLVFDSFDYDFDPCHLIKAILEFTGPDDNIYQKIQDYTEFYILSSDLDSLNVEIF